MAEQDSLVKNAADPKQVKKAGERVLSQRELELNDLAWLLSEIQGRRFIWRLFDFIKMNGLSFAGENHSTTDFNEGMKNVGHKLLADIMECRPEAYIEMLNENKKEGVRNGGR